MRSYECGSSGRCGDCRWRKCSCVCHTTAGHRKGPRLAIPLVLLTCAALTLACRPRTAPTQVCVSHDLIALIAYPEYMALALSCTQWATVTPTITVPR